MTRKHRGSTLNAYLDEQGLLDETRIVAIKEVLAWQIEQAMKEQALSKSRMAGLMKTSRAQLDRLLDPQQGNVTIETLQRAAKVLGRQLRIELV